jgi:hypothetical protein
MRADADLMVYVAARWPALVREAVLLGVHPDEAADAATDALARCRREWDRTGREGSVDTLVHDELVRAAARRSRTPETTRERAASELLVLAPPALDDLKRRERDQHRAALKRAGIVAVPLLLVAAGAGAFVSTYGASPDRDSLGTVKVTREENPAPGVFWYADGRLHLDHVVLDVTGVHQVSRIGDGVVYGDDDGRVVHTGDDGSRTLLGHKDPGSPVVASDESGWAAWVDPSGHGSTLVVEEAETGNVVRTFSVDARARVIAVDGNAVFYSDAEGSHVVPSPSRDVGPYGPAPLLDVRSRVRVSQISPDTIEVVQPIFNQSFDVPGRGAMLAPDGAYAVTRNPDTGTIHVYDARSGEEVASGLTADDHVLAVALAPPRTVAYIVDPGGPDTALQLRTCALDSPICRIAARIPDDSGTALLAR